MKLGIKRKLLLVLVGSLVLTTTMHALLASYFTNRQNEASAFAILRLELLAWQNELQEQTLQLRESALAAVSDGALLNQLAELIALEFDRENAPTSDAAHQTERTLAYLKSVSINRLHLVLRTGGFSSVSVFTRGTLSHHVSTTGAGMAVRVGNSGDTWLSARINGDGDLPVGAWPAWLQSDQRPTYGHPSADRPTVSFDYTDPRHIVVEVAVPVQGVIEEILTDSEVHPKGRFVSDIAIAGSGVKPKVLDPRPAPRIFAMVVFRRLIDQTELQKVATKTGTLPVVLSPTGTLLQRAQEPALPFGDLPRSPDPSSPNALPPTWQGILSDERGSFYAALQTWSFDQSPALVLGLATSRDATLQNIRQTVVALLSATSLILLFSIGAGILLMGRLINPVIALTHAVKAIGLHGRNGTQHNDEGRPAPDWMRPVEIEAPDEVGELTRAFNLMIGELRTALETLEQRVQGRTAELRQQTRYLRTLIDTLPLQAWLKDTDGRYLAANQATAEACGHKVTDIVSKTDFELWPHKLAEAYRADDSTVMSSKRRMTRVEVLTDAESTIWIETSRAPVLDEDGTVLGTVGAARDISESKAVETAREAALMEAERLARLRSEFLAQMSHELRTPLNGILGYAQVLQRDKTLNHKQIEGLKVIQQSGKHLLMLINDILDLAKLEAGKLELNPGNLALRDFLIIIGDIVRVKAEEKELVFDCDLAPDLPEEVWADEKRLRQILLNLLSNAIKFTNHGTVHLSVRCLSGTRLRFEVRDTGIGIAENQRDTIFQPFEQAGDLLGRIGGAGLGLAISRQFVQLMGGDIQVTSSVGEGSTFWFELELPVMQTLPSRIPVNCVINAHAGQPKTILVVDDRAENRHLVIDMLAPLGFTVLEAADGREALDQAQSLRPDLILMDTVMPGMDGLETTRRLRQIAELAHTPVIAVLASVSGSDAQSSLEAGADAFLPKPLDLDALLVKLATFLKLEWAQTLAPGAAPRAEAQPALIPPPLAELEILHALALQGDMRKIILQADRVAALDQRFQPFSARLRRFAEAYQSRALLKWVEQYLPERTEP